MNDLSVCLCEKAIPKIPHLSLSNRPDDLPNGNVYCYQESAFAVESLFVTETESYAHNWPHKFTINGN